VSIITVNFQWLFVLKFYTEVFLNMFPPVLQHCWCGIGNWIWPAVIPKGCLLGILFTVEYGIFELFHFVGVVLYSTFHSTQLKEMLSNGHLTSGLFHPSLIFSCFEV